MKLSIVVPIFNEEEVIQHTAERLRVVSMDVVGSHLVETVEVIFVDDGSIDGTVKNLNEWIGNSRSDFFSFKLIRFSRNFGHSFAVLAGLEEASGDYISIIDADLQDPPELISQMLTRLIDGDFDVVYGQRRLRSGETLFKKVTAWLFYRLINFLSQVEIPKDTGDFRVMTREVRNAVLEIGDPEPFIRGLVAWVGFKQEAFLYHREAREFGVTKYPLRKMLKFALQAIMSFSSFPLKLSIYIGVIGILLSFGVGFYALAVWIMGRALPGWTSLVIVFSFGQSLAFFLIGVLGLYVGRIHTASQNRPRYIKRR